VRSARLHIPDGGHSLSGVTRPLLLLSACLLASAIPLRAQGIRGRLLEATAEVPVVGSLVVLEDSAGKRVAQTVSGTEGRFVLRAPSPGHYLLRVLRIGYFPFESPVVLEPDKYVDRTLALAGTPVSLPEISVVGKSMCGDRARGDTLSSALWLQAGTALAITAQTVQSHAYRFETTLENRNIDRLGNATDITTLNELSISAWPVRSPPPDQLLANGFVENIEDVVEGPTWYGPDAEFLLSEPFFSGHCFWTVPPGIDESSDWVGLAFEPGVKDSRSDIKGTVWLDRKSAQLRRLDFYYTKIPKWARGYEAGGVLTFAPLPGGGWIVQRWMLRVPLPQRTTPGSMKVYGYRESGGHVLAVLDARGQLVHSYPN
jgi:hypothetical protein